MEQKQVIEEEQESMRLIQSENANISIENSSNLDELYYEIDDFGVKRMREQSSQIKCLKKSKQLFIKELLKTLGYQNTLHTFQQQCTSALGDKNPEEASHKKRMMTHKKKEFDQSLIKQIIENHQNYDTMMESLQNLCAQQERIDEQQSATYADQKALSFDFQNKIKSLYSSRQEATIPKYKNIEIHLEGKQVKFIDINASQELCLLDSQDYLHVITSQGEIKPLKIDDAKQIVYLKWINKSIIFLVNYNCKVTVLSYDKNQVKILTPVELNFPKIKKICLLVVKYPENPDKEYVRILLRTENSQFIASQIVVQKQTIKFTGGTLFQSKFLCRSYNLLKVPKLQRMSKEQDHIDTEHYYGLTDNSKSIIKFDTIVKKQGVLWTTNRKIDSWVNSKCRYFLIMLIVDSKQRKTTVRVDKKIESKLEYLFQYQFVKMNGHGCIIQRLPLDFINPLIPNHFASNPTPMVISRFKLMDPEWLGCFDWEESIVYVSLKTGKILHIQDLDEKQIQVIGVGPTNCIVYKSEEKIFLMSIHEEEKRRVVLEKRMPSRDRESLILRLTRNGIPQTLLQLLQELRNNQIELVEN